MNNLMRTGASKCLISDCCFENLFFLKTDLNRCYKFKKNFTVENRCYHFKNLMRIEAIKS